MAGGPCTFWANSETRAEITRVVSSTILLASYTRFLHTQYIGERADRGTADSPTCAVAERLALSGQLMSSRSRPKRHGQSETGGSQLRRV